MHTHRQTPEAAAAPRKCLFLYITTSIRVRVMHARIQTWFPFSIQVPQRTGVVGRAMDAAASDTSNGKTASPGSRTGAGTTHDDDRSGACLRLPRSIARGLNPLHDTSFRLFRSNITVGASTEWAPTSCSRYKVSDTASTRKLSSLTDHVFSPDVMRFLGRNIPPSGKLPPSCGRGGQAHQDPSGRGR